MGKCEIITADKYCLNCWDNDERENKKGMCSCTKQRPECHCERDKPKLDVTWKHGHVTSDGRDAKYLGKYAWFAYCMVG